ncbi:WG repeat-containing protein [Flavobacteriaceae bacterium TP-CH-4]|uniref:WG repeat-containing protein n=1 Tax=Pelagihabitans pacificus TaxID=2696054 RepID=A0A967AST1_9FLAO|nr:WG repeat-containing protein [Pelagihabitans pacificus]NHF59706.1 WG repeat-containing protein [Pelagihabitans pacificus]
MKRLALLVLGILPIILGAQTLNGIDEIAPFSEGLAAVRQGDQWGFIDEEGQLVIDFRNDLHWNKNADTSQEDITGVRYPMFKEGLCMIRKIVEEGVPVYGFINTEGKVVIEPQFLNIYPFENGYATGVLFHKTLKGENEFKLKIYEFKFHDVLVHTSGKIEEYFEPRQNIQMTSKRYRLPDIGAKLLTEGLIAVHVRDKGWEVRKLTL